MSCISWALCKSEFSSESEYSYSSCSFHLFDIDSCSSLHLCSRSLMDESSFQFLDIRNSSYMRVSVMVVGIAYVIGFLVRAKKLLTSYSHGSLWQLWEKPTHLLPLARWRIFLQIFLYLRFVSSSILLLTIRFALLLSATLDGTTILWS